MAACGKRQSRAGDDHGQILILTALSLTAVLGIGALSLDASFMYDKRNRLHAAADAAAKSAAIEVLRNSAVTQTELEAFADQQVEAHGFAPARSGGATSVVVNRGPATGPFAGNVNYVEVIASEATKTFFANVLGLTAMTPGARAVAGLSSAVNCLIVLDSSPAALSIGNATINTPGCGVANGGGLATTNPNATINASSIAVTGSCTGQGCANMSGMQTGVDPPPSDPLEGLLPPTNPGGCSSVSNPGASVPAGCYSSMSFTNGTYSLDAGTYYITGPVLMGNNVTLTGSGVLLYFSGAAATGPCTSAATAGCISVGNSVEFHLSAQTSGTYNGILMFQDPLDHLNADFYGNNPIYDLSGAMYFPGADLFFRNGLGFTNDCMLFIVRSLFINNGNGAFANTCSAYGGSPIKSTTIAE